jgi:F420H(2)-dependent quinone reductase
MADGDDFVVVGGFPRIPAWVHNLRANPDAEIQLGRERIAVRASEPTASDRDELWRQAIEHNPFWAQSQDRVEHALVLMLLRRR